MAALAALSPKTGSACGSCWRSMRRADSCWTCPSSKNLGKDAGKWCIRMFDDVWCLLFLDLATCRFEAAYSILDAKIPWISHDFSVLLPCSTHVFFCRLFAKWPRCAAMQRRTSKYPRLPGAFPCQRIWPWGESKTRNIYCIYIYIIYILKPAEQRELNSVL